MNLFRDISLFIAGLSQPFPAASLAERPTHWARPVLQEGLPNLHWVAEGVYRSAMPTLVGLEALPALGVSTVIQLEYSPLRVPGVVTVPIPMPTWRVDAAKVAQVFEVLDQVKGGVLIHCLHGADRTGLICALYRRAAEAWTPTEAIDEMVRGGYGFHPFWSHLVHRVRR